MTGTSRTDAAFRLDIQGLRALAVGSVLLAHAGIPLFQGGFVGVDVFFVLSGYLITGLLLRERLATGGIRYGRFLARRLRRLLPAMLAMLVLTFAVAAVVLTAYEMRMQSRSFPYAVTWISNFFFAFNDWDYFKALQADDLFLHTWSLGVEEQFYVLWPWLILLFTGIAHRTGDAAAVAGRLLVAMIAVFAVGLAACIALSMEAPILAYYMMPARGWQFALGAAVFAATRLPSVVAYREGAPARADRIAEILGATGLVLILLSVLLLGPTVTYPGYLALFPSLGAALVVAAGSLPGRCRVVGILRAKPLVWIGDRSYSIYLWHWPVFILGASLGIVRSATGVAVLVGIAVMLAALSYRWIELPFWKGRWSAARPVRVWGYSALAMAGVVGLASSLAQTTFGNGNVPASADGYDPRFDAPANIYSADRKCDTRHLSAQLVPCGIGNPDGERLAILLGDSIGAQWSSMLAAVYPSPEWQVIVLTKSACAIVDVTYYYDKAGGNYDVCTTWRDSALQYIEMLRPDVVVVGSSAAYEFGADQWVDGSARVFGQLAPAAGQVIVIAGTPKLTFDGPSCLEDPYRFSFRRLGGHRECEEPLGETVAHDVAAYLEEAASAFENVALLDLNDLVCPANQCAASTADGDVVFRDHSHLTMSFVNSLAPEARARIKALAER